MKEQYKVTGADKKTGEDRCETVSANSIQKAADAARAKGMYVSNVEKLCEDDPVAKPDEEITAGIIFLAICYIGFGLLLIITVLGEGNGTIENGRDMEWFAIFGLFFTITWSFIRSLKNS